MDVVRQNAFCILRMRLQCFLKISFGTPLMPLFVFVLTELQKGLPSVKRTNEKLYHQLTKQDGIKRFQNVDHFYLNMKDQKCDKKVFDK